MWVVLGDQSDPTPLASFRGDYERKIAKCMWFLPFGLGRAEGERWDLFVASLEGLEEEDPSWACFSQPHPASRPLLPGRVVLMKDGLDSTGSLSGGPS